MRYAPYALAALCALVLFTGLDRVGFTDAREARDARVTHELIANRELITPLYANDTLLEKPVFAYVPEALAAWLSRATGTSGTPVRSRQIRALAALALLFVTASIAKRHFGTRAGWWSALALASTLGLPLAARTDGTQMWATLFGWIGCGALADGVVSPKPPSAAPLLFAYLSLAVVLLVAGPLPALWPLGAVALYATLARDRRLLSRVRPLAGLALLAGVALPWYGAMLDRQGAGFALHAAWFPYGAEGHGPWYTGPLLALSFLVVASYPWSALAPEAMLHAATWWRFAPRRSSGGAGSAPPAAAEPATRTEQEASAFERERREESAAHFFIAALVASLVPVALHAGAPLSAALPALPAAAMLCGRLIDHVFEDPTRLARPIARAARMMALVGSAGALLLAVAAQRVPEAAADLRLLAAVLFLTSWLPLLATLRDRPRLAAALMTLPIALGAPITTAFVVPDMEGYLNARVVAVTMDQQAPPLAPLAVIEPPPPSLRLYVRRNLVLTSPSAAAFDDLRAADGLTYFAFPPARESEVARRLGVPLEIVSRNPTLVLARVNPDSSLVAAPPARP